MIQTLFPMMLEDTPPESELSAYADRLNALKAAGAKIKEVQIYSATRPQTRNECGHLPLRHLSRIAAGVREATGLTVNIY